MNLRLFTFSLLLVAWAMPLTVWAQTTELNQEEMLERIVERCSTIETMRCEFVQTRKIPLMEEAQESGGYMLYKNPSALKWAYTTPFVNSMTMDGHKMILNDGSGEHAIEGEGGRVFRGMAGIIIGCMTGSSLKDGSMFTVVMSSSDAGWRALLTPKRREIKRMFTQIEMIFDPRQALLESITLTEQGGGSTEIKINNVSLNGNYDSEW